MTFSIITLTDPSASDDAAAVWETIDRLDLLGTRRISCRDDVTGDNVISKSIANVTAAPGVPMCDAAWTSTTSSRRSVQQKGLLACRRWITLSARGALRVEKPRLLTRSCWHANGDSS